MDKIHKYQMEAMLQVNEQYCLKFETGFNFCLHIMIEIHIVI